MIRVLVTILVCAVSALAEAPPKLRIPRVTRPPALEDYLKGGRRDAEVRVTGFRQREPGDGTPVSQETDAYLSYDDKNLYVIFVCRDDPAKVRARMSKREDFGSDDVVGVVLDTFHEGQRAYMFLTNPLGIQQDGIAAEGKDDDYSFDTLWHSEGRLTEDGYVVWMALSFRSLRFPNAEKQTWGLALGRIIVRNNETSFWPYITRRTQSFTQQLAVAEGLEHISPGRNVQLIPYMAFSRSSFLDRNQPAFRSSSEARGGLDAKVILRDALTLDVALNPDFSQVESDEPQVLVNQRYEVFFPEKRPFFIENAGFFQTPETLFFSRRIADPQFGARLTGKVRHWALGLLAADDRAPGRQEPLDSPWRDNRALIGVLSARREFARQSSVGLLITNRDFGSSFNRVFSLDTRLKIRGNWVFTGQAIRSYDRALDGSRRSGPAYNASINHSGRHFQYNGYYTDRSPDFRANALGFINRVDVRQMEHSAGYTWLFEHKYLVSIWPQARALVNWDRMGRLQDWSGSAVLGMDLKRQTSLVVFRGRTFELFGGNRFVKDRWSFSGKTAWLKWLEGDTTWQHGTAVNYYPGPGFRPGEALPPFLAQRTAGSVSLTFRPAPRLRLSGTYLYTRLGAGAAHVPGLTGSPAIFNNHIARSKVNYQFTRRLSLRAILDYNAVLPNPLLVSQERSKRINGDVLLTYLVNPGTALYVGYTDGYENLALDRLRGSLYRTAAPTEPVGRQFFIKLSYLFRF